MELHDLWGFLTGGLIGGFLGAFLGGFAKFFWERWLPDRLTWQRDQKVQREKVLSELRGPAIRAVGDLQGRVFAILRNNAANYRYVKSIGEADYYIKSTAFVTAQAFAWEEILRQRVGALDYSDIVRQLDRFSEAVAYGGRGFQIWRLEQREIGERMLAGGESDGACLTYSEFRDLYQGEQPPRCFIRLADMTKAMLEDSAPETVRLIAIQHSLVDLIDFLDPSARWIPREDRTKVAVRKTLDRLQLVEDEKSRMVREAERRGLL